MAKKFHFRLEQVLHLRKSDADDARIQLSEAEQARKKKEEEKEERQQYYCDLLAQTQQGRTSASAVESLWHHVRAVQAEIAALEKQCVQLEEIENVKRLVFAEAVKKQRVLEKLKDKKKTLYQQELNQEEQKVMDDIAQRSRYSLLR